ncbi:hypothetical protein [Pseudomonas aeruginosa]|uniref:hypothetical protein n=2 Tax=Pseudomonas aeruginosa TaxID=287 RepID=UPI00104B4F00|nr:hypothetical protein [Pseudomonas aeruginosa]
MEYKIKYDKETINRLAEKALIKSKVPDMNHYLDNLYYITINGTIDRWRELIINELSDKTLFDALHIIEKIQLDVSNVDIVEFKNKKLLEKAYHFRLANFANVNPKEYRLCEKSLRELGSISSNYFKEACNLESNNEQISEYAQLTSRVRDNFSKKYKSELDMIQKIIKDFKKVNTNPIQNLDDEKQEVKKKNKLKL